MRSRNSPVWRTGEAFYRTKEENRQKKHEDVIDHADG